MNDQLIAQCRDLYLKSNSEYEKARDDFYERISKKQEKIRRLEEQINRLRDRQNRITSPPSWVAALVKPLAEELAYRLNLKYDIYGPFGLRCETSIYLMDDLDVSITEQPTKSITLIPGDLTKGEMRYETGNMREDAPSYRPDTIGYMNGFGKETLPLPDSIDEIISLLRYSE